MPQFEARFEAPYRVRFDEAGANGLLPASGFLRYAQDAAWQHSEAAGFDRGWYAERGLTWLVRSVQLEVLAPVPFGAELVMSTEIVGFRRVWARRLSQARSADRSCAARLLIDWVILGPSGGPVRLPHEITDPLPDMPSFTPLRVPQGEPIEARVALPLNVRTRDLDPMDHVNNAVYLDYLDEGVVAAGAASDVERSPRRYSVEYVVPAEAGVQLSAEAGRAGAAGWTYRLLNGERIELFRGRLD